MPNRLFAIGDIHGCHVALRALIQAIDPKPEDTIVVLGDVIDWGPDSRDCVQQLIDLSGRCQFILVRGNHEEMAYAALESQSELRYWLNFGGDETLNQKDQIHPTAAGHRKVAELVWPVLEPLLKARP